MKQKDPYEILGVSRGASQDEIKRNYRRLAKELHPDRNPGNKTAEEKFKELQAAYEVLGDPERRSQFDQFGAGGPPPNFQNWGQGGTGPPFGGVDVDFGGDLSSIFEQFFRRPGSRARPRRTTRRAKPRGANLEHVLSLSFEEAARGTTRELVLPSGNGRKPGERIEVRIPPGVNDNQRIRVRGKGVKGPGGPGDLMIRCRVQPHPYFRRDGADIFLDLPLSITEASLGAKVEIPTLEGTTVLTIPPGTSSGTKLRLRGKGIRTSLGDAGDLYAITKIVIPKNLTPRAKELLAEIGEELNHQPRATVGWSR